MKKALFFDFRFLRVHAQNYIVKHEIKQGKQVSNTLDNIEPYGRIVFGWVPEVMFRASRKWLELQSLIAECLVGAGDRGPGIFC